MFSQRKHFLLSNTVSFLNSRTYRSAADSEFFLVDDGVLPPIAVAYRTMAGSFEMGYHIQGQHEKPDGQPPHCRPGYEIPTEAAPRDGLPQVSPFASAKDTLKYRAYNSTCHSFLDLFLREDIHNHHLNTSDPPTHHHQRVQIEIGSRTRASPIDKKTGLLTSQQRFIDGAIQTWPPPNAPDALTHLLNPFSDRPCDLRADSNERSIVYMIGPVDEQPRRKPMTKGLKLNIGDLTFDGPGAFKIGDVLKGKGISDAPTGSGERILRYWPALEGDDGVFTNRVQEIPVTESMRLQEEEEEEDAKGHARAEETAEKTDDNAIVLVNFDDTYFRGFRRMRLGLHDNHDDDDDHDKEEEEEEEEEEVSSLTSTLANENINVDESSATAAEGKGKEPERGRKEREEKDGDRQWFRTEPAM